MLGQMLQAEYSYQLIIIGITFIGITFKISFASR